MNNLYSFVNIYIYIYIYSIVGYCWSSVVVMVRSFNFRLLEARPEAFGRPLLDRGTERDRKMTSNNTHAHIVRKWAERKN